MITCRIREAARRETNRKEKKNTNRTQPEKIGRHRKGKDKCLTKLVLQKGIVAEQAACKH